MSGHNPFWPFPQFDEQGKQLLPAGWGKRQAPDLSQYEEAPL